MTIRALPPPRRWDAWPRVTVRLPLRLLSALDLEANTRGTHRAAFVREVLADALAVEVTGPTQGQRATLDSRDSYRTLTPRTAALLRSHHLSSGRSYRASAALAGIDQGFFWKLCAGQRAPSVATAEKLIRGLDLPPELAERLQNEAVESPWR